MGSWARKGKRKNLVRKKKLAEKEMAKKVKLMGNLPDECMTCEAPFDKKNREQVFSWRVVVREKEDKVNLYCPPCWERATKLVEELKDRVQKRRNDK
jgi:hypothetical protein